MAELTERNANVYYELGLAHAWKKKTIMISQDIDAIPFDLKHLRMVVYAPATDGQLTDILVKEFVKITKNRTRSF